MDRWWRASALAGVCLLVPAMLAHAGTTGGSITPGRYPELASGVAYIQARACSGRVLAVGTGFLVGDKVVMTARHVLNVKRACGYRVVVGNRNFSGGRVYFWRTSRLSRDADKVDVATMRIDRPPLCPGAPCHVFRFANVVPRPRTVIAMIGFPLGGPKSLAQGPLVAAYREDGIPTLLVRTTSNQGASGSPMIAPSGKVVGVLQRGFVENGSGEIAGLNLVRWWGPGVVRDLCRAYPSGGIPGCAAASSPPPPSGAPTPVSITTQSIPPATVAAPYRFQLRATGGSGSGRYWSITPTTGELPPGLSLSSNGLISGTPTLAGSDSFGVDVRDDENYNGYQVFRMTVR